MTGAKRSGRSEIGQLSVALKMRKRKASCRNRLRDKRQVAAVRAAFGDYAAFDIALQEGRAMSSEQAVRYALDGEGTSN
jgi:hypothetical protein